MLRRSHSRAWARSALSAAVLVLAVAGLSTGATAEEKYRRLYVFGDSYADVTLSDQAAQNTLAQPFPPGFPGLSFWRVYPVPLADKLSIPRGEIVDVAVGGATASPSAAAPDQAIVHDLIKPGNLSASG